MRRILLTSVASATVLVLAYAASSDLRSANNAECIPVFNGLQSQVCTTQAQEDNVDWLQWAQFKSKSVQLHFLDLVELVFGAEPPRSVQRKPIEDQSQLLR